MQVSNIIHVQYTHTCKYIQVCRHTGRQITTRRGLACRQTDERRDARTMMTAHHCCWWVDCERDGWRWWNEETQTEGETDMCGVSWSLCSQLLYFHRLVCKETDGGTKGRDISWAARISVIILRHRLNRLFQVAFIHSRLFWNLRHWCKLAFLADF